MSFGGSRSVTGLFPESGLPAPARLPPWPGRIFRETRRPTLIGSSLYAIGLLIERLASSPVAGADDTDALSANREAHGQDAASHLPERKVPTLRNAMRSVFGKDKLWVIENLDREIERNSVLLLIDSSLLLAPFELHEKGITADA